MNAVFKSDNIDFIKISADLIDDYLKMVNDQEISKLISLTPHLYTYEEELDWVNKKLAKDATIFSMIESKTGNFIGNVEVMHIDGNSCEIGISITKEYQNRHLGTEALKTLIDYCFSTLKLNEIKLIVFSINKRAIHCYEKLGFVKYKVDPNVTIIDNEEVDDIYMKLSKY